VAGALRVTTRARLVWGAAAAAALFACFPQWIAGRVVDLGAGLAWLAPALFLMAIRGLTPRRAAVWGLGVSWVADSAILYWIYVVTVEYGHAHPLVGVVAPIALALYIAVFGAAFATGHAWLAERGLASPWSAAFAWTALDHLRSFALTGFPWATLGYAQHENAPLLGLASFTGVYGLSFVSVLGSAALLEAGIALRERRRPGYPVIAAGVAVLGLHGLGLAAPHVEGQQTVRVAVVQGNIDQGVKWSSAWVLQTLETYESLSREAVEAGAEIVVWPETAVPGAIELDPALRARIAALARETGAGLVVGGVGLALDELGQPASYFDSAFLFSPDGELGGRYDKTHLVPFGEYIPFQELLGRFLTAVARGIARVGVEPGAAPRAVSVVAAGGREIAFGVPVCYELLFPDLVRRFALDGGRALLAITNDAWYGRTGAPYQFLAITALRSAETGLWTARAANTGVSGFIDGSGEVRVQTPIFETTWRVADVPLHPDPREATFYVRHGDVFAWGCWLVWLVYLGAGALRARGRDGVRGPGG